MLSTERNGNEKLNKLDFTLRILKLFTIFSISSFWLYHCVTILPELDEAASINRNDIKFPKSFNELNTLAKALNIYSTNHFWKVFLLFSSAYLYKQAFAIPGSVFLNILAGALYGPIYGTIITSIYSAIGSTCCYLFSKHIFGVLISHFFHSKVEKIQNFINAQSNSGSLFSILISLRFFPMSPNWLMNMSAPLIGIPIKYFTCSVFIGLIPYNFVGAQAGSIISQIESVGDFLTWNVLILFISMAGISSLPAIIKNVNSSKTKN